jgi:hypothetical protein
MTQEGKLSSASGGSGASGPARQPLEPTSLITKNTLEGAPWEAGLSRHSLTLSVLEQATRMTLKASLAPRHRHGP